MAEQFKTSLFWSFMEQGGNSLVGLIVQITLARILAPEEFGVMAILLVFISVMNSLAQSGMGSSLIQQSHADRDSFSTALWLTIAIAMIMYGILFIFSPVIASFYGMPNLELYLRALGVVVIFNSFNSIQRSYLQRSLEFKKTFKANFTTIVVSGVIGIAMAFFGCGIWALISQSIAQSVFGCIMLAIFTKWKPRFVYKKKEAIELFRYGWKICATGIVNNIYNGVSELVIGKCCTAADLGLYSQGRKYPNFAIGVIFNALSNVLFPAFAKMKHDPQLLRESIKKVLSAGTFVIAPMSLLLCVIAEPLITLLLTEKWVPATLIFQLTFAVNAFLMFQLVNLRAYMALGASGLYFKVNLIKAIIGASVICSTAIITKDIYWTAFATSVFGVGSIFFIDMHSAKKMFGYGTFQQCCDQLPTYCIAILATIVSAACCFLPVHYLVKMLIQVIVFVIIYIYGSLIANRRTWDLCMNTLRDSK